MRYRVVIRDILGKNNMIWCGLEMQPINLGLGTACRVFRAPGFQAPASLLANLAWVGQVLLPAYVECWQAGRLHATKHTNEQSPTGPQGSRSQSPFIQKGDHSEMGRKTHALGNSIVSLSICSALDKKIASCAWDMILACDVVVWYLNMMICMIVWLKTTRWL